MPVELFGKQNTGRTTKDVNMKIKIQNLKNISKLDFDLPFSGLWLLTGANGSGKTSLLTALYRIGNGRAFQDHFKTTPGQNKLDTFQDTKITYEFNGRSVTYSYGGHRWRPKPSKNSDVLNEAPYKDIVFISANASRVEPHPNEIKPSNTKAVANSITTFMVDILENNKWHDLVCVNTQRGRGSRAYLILDHAGKSKNYYSEKNFSLGEFCVLKLAQKICEVPCNSMILIDEIEMALHPLVQVNLLNKLKKIAKEKNLTIIFSTHSSTLIKHVERSNVIFLKNDNGAIKVKQNVFPAEVLNELAFDEELNYDFLLFVEDEEAKLLLTELCSLYEKNNPERFLYRIIPAGGYSQVIGMLKNSTGIFPKHVKRFAFLDLDVKEELPNLQGNANDPYNKVKKNVKFLPITPELGVIEMLESDRDANRDAALNLKIDGTDVKLKNLMKSEEYTEITNEKPREAAKKKLSVIVEGASRLCGADETKIRSSIYLKFCSNLNGGELKALLGPVFNSDA